jgi:maltose alpha-D-glucosyltransferase/alpha-amylase
MYKEYARDPRMKMNVGIRRRLAPLLDNNRPTIELFHALLFSLPGSPIMYYGDEIGMGDNIFLGDRDGVRTPMQWSIDRNAGFSRTDFAALYAPPIMDPVYGYQAINVEAQQRHPSSLLHWVRNIINVRKQHAVFGVGDFRPLNVSNAKVLAFLREGAGETLLIVANMANSAQPVELDLSAYNGKTPVELFAGTTFPNVGELPYLLTLAPHGYYWFELTDGAA